MGCGQELIVGIECDVVRVAVVFCLKKWNSCVEVPNRNFIVGNVECYVVGFGLELDLLVVGCVIFCDVDHYSKCFGICVLGV